MTFPDAESVLFVSPRSNYQTVAQEIARIRSRAGAVKESTIYFYAGTEEQAKAQRLAAHMQLQAALVGSGPVADTIPLADLSGRLVPCTVEAFVNQRNLFVVAIPKRLLRRGRRIRLAG